MTGCGTVKKWDFISKSEAKMAECFKCGKNIYFSHIIEIDGKEEVVCAVCDDMTCSLCGKTKKDDDIRRWTIEIDPETGNTFAVGSCCTFVMGKMDMFKLYSEKYNNMRKNNPEALQGIVNEGQRKATERQKEFHKPEVASRLIDSWAKSQKLKKREKK